MNKQSHHSAWSHSVRRGSLSWSWGNPNFSTSIHRYAIVSFYCLFWRKWTL